MANSTHIQAQPSTRHRILDAAVKRFAMASFDEVSLRDIAGDVGVDVAYVHRCFGSKAKLFDAVLSEISGGKELLVGQDARPEETTVQLVSRLLNKPRDEHDNGIGPMDVLIRSMASKNASKVLREKVEREFIPPLAERAGNEGELRAATIMAILVGIGMARDVLQLKPLVADDSQDRVRQLLEAATSAVTDTDLG